MRGALPVQQLRSSGTALAIAALVVAIVLGACLATRQPAPPPAPAPASVPAPLCDAIVVCGTLVPTGTPVVTWFDPDGYDSYSTELRFPDAAPEDPTFEAPDGLRYRPGRERGEERVTRRSDIEALGAVVDQVVLHYDACGSSRKCFEILHDRRGLSCHFLLDVDGTIYQTLDLAETAWHARQANPRSIGIEIANVGAYPPGTPSPLDDLTGDPVRFRGTVNGSDVEMTAFTPRQYESLTKLLASLCDVFPLIHPDVPRDTDGSIRVDVLSDDEYEAFRGILGHQHVSSGKTDPGPAFDWERLLRQLR